MNMRSLLVAFVLLVAHSSRSAAQSVFHLLSWNAFISGTSTLHDWHSQIDTIKFTGSIHADGTNTVVIRDIDVCIPVRGIRSHEGSIMDDKTFAAFKSEKYPNITFTARSAQAIIGADHTLVIATEGTLTMAGTSLPVALSGNGQISDDGQWHLNIAKELNMEDYRMTPPAAVLGTIRVGPVVTVHFDLVLSEKESQIIEVGNK